MLKNKIYLICIHKTDRLIISELKVLQGKETKRRKS